ncbi:type-F conjugative transfer system pilin assembly protein TrbC [Thiothrix sp.]|jgi:conjugal transfer pilus assembly protein TrbC|uniref:type-F conjugative transfer system pilin assembly protein TrbC n=1 Tax=Thiothrix sp. TaxID=1032 RepID=UPI002579B484|nr:type-F conjugative transfer system pilin assembly protein TrbC [Thiothrix sp.]
MMKVSPTALIPAALFVLAIGVAGDLWSADAAAMPTDAQVAAQQQQQATLPLPGAAAVDAAKGKIADALAAPELSTDKVAGHMPRLNGIPLIPQTPGALDSLFAQVEKRPLLPALRSDGELLIAVSFSLPPATLKNLATQADRAGAVLVLRGMVNDSLADTSKAIQAVMGDDAGDSTFQVNPNVFSAYAVQDVPTFILAKKAADGESACAAGTDYVSVRGDVTLTYALRELAKQPHWDTAAQRYLAALGVKP